MSAHVTPLDPDSPAGIAAAKSITEGLAQTLIAIRKRERAAAQRAV